MHLNLTRTDNTVLKQFEGSSSKHYYKDYKTINSEIISKIIISYF